MASYRYERDIDPKDLQPRKQRQYTRKERWANWWDYNLKWVIIIGIIVVFFGYNFIGQYFFTVHADYNVAVVAPHYLPEATQTALQDTLAAYGEDRSPTQTVTGGTWSTAGPTARCWRALIWAITLLMLCRAKAAPVRS